MRILRLDRIKAAQTVANGPQALGDNRFQRALLMLFLSFFLSFSCSFDLERAGKSLSEPKIVQVRPGPGVSQALLKQFPPPVIALLNCAEFDWWRPNSSRLNAV